MKHVHVFQHIPLHDILALAAHVMILDMILQRHFTQFKDEIPASMRTFKMIPGAHVTLVHVIPQRDGIGWEFLRARLARVDATSR